MQVSFSVLGEVEVDDHIDGLDIDSSGEKIYWRKTEDHTDATTGPDI